MDRRFQWVIGAASVVAVSSSATAFAQSQPKHRHDKHTETTKTANEGAESPCEGAKTEQAGVTTTTAAEPTTTSSTPVPGAERAPGGVLVNKPMVITGAAILVGAYVPSALAGILGRPDDKSLIAPVVGPWIALGERDCDAAAPCTNEGLDKFLMVLSGVAQGAGLTIMALGVFIPPGTPRIRSAERSSTSAFAPRLQVTPLSMGGRGAGLGAVGVF